MPGKVVTRKGAINAFKATRTNFYRQQVKISWNGCLIVILKSAFIKGDIKFLKIVLKIPSFWNFRAFYWQTANCVPINSVDEKIVHRTNITKSKVKKSSCFFAVPSATAVAHPFHSHNDFLIPLYALSFLAFFSPSYFFAFSVFMFEIQQDRDLLWECI